MRSSLDMAKVYNVLWTEHRCSSMPSPRRQSAGTTGSLDLTATTRSSRPDTRQRRREITAEAVCSTVLMGANGAIARTTWAGKDAELVNLPEMCGKWINASHRKMGQNSTC